MLKRIDSIPTRLKLLTVPLPTTLQRIKLVSMGVLIPILSDGLEELSLDNCNAFSERLSQGLKSLEIRWVGRETNKIGIRGRFPDSLRVLSLRECKRLGEIGDLPKGLRELSVLSCNEEEKEILLKSLSRGSRELEI
jgi:hypothetical protein